MHPEHEHLTVKDLEQYLRVGTTTAYRLIHEEGFPMIRISPRRIVIPKTALDEWLKERTEMRREEAEG